jgi:hypothetical protein
LLLLAEAEEQTVNKALVEVRWHIVIILPYRPAVLTRWSLAQALLVLLTAAHQVLLFAEQLQLLEAD